MAKKTKENKDNSIIEAELNEESRKIMEKFLDHYRTSETSPTVYKNAILNLVWDTTITNFRQFRFEHYSNIASLKVLKQTFLKYLYAYNFLENEQGFIGELENKNSIQKHFERLLDKTEKKEIIYTPLTVEQLWKIQEVMDIATKNIETLKMKFCWYMLFEQGCSVTELKNIKSSNFINGKIVTGKKTYSIPDEFRILFSELGGHKYDGFTMLNKYIEDLGKIAGIEGLVPKQIVVTKKNNMIRCCSCNNEYMNVQDNWNVVNGLVICIGCYSELKKKLNVEIQELKSHTIEVSNSEEKFEKESLVSTFEELLAKVPSKIDYLKLHEFQIMIGKLGEAFVYDLERERLKPTQYYEMVDKTKALNAKNGYDILSYDFDGNPIFIEVKATAEDEAEFYLTETERNKAIEAREKGIPYLIYRVSNILSKNKDEIKYKVIYNVLNNDEYLIRPYHWKVSLVT